MIMEKTRRRRIVLATDLSARCDRAFERAVLLADEWGAQVTVVHALERQPSGRAPGPRWRTVDRESLSAESQIMADLHRAGIAADIVVRRGPASELIAEIAGSTSCDLIVTGIARELGFSRTVLGATLEALARKSAAPILIASRPVRGSYEKAVVGTNFSPGSRAALQATLELFQQAKTTALHAYRPTLEGLGSADGDNETAYRHVLGECTQFVADAVPAAWRKVQCLAEAGAPEMLLKDYVLDRNADLIAVGSESRNAMATILLGSTSTSLILSSPCDLLLVPAGWTAAPDRDPGHARHGSQAAAEVAVPKP
jgi:nucleotide-binding universal stress UspA family protein